MQCSKGSNALAEDEFADARDLPSKRADVRRDREHLTGTDPVKRANLRGNFPRMIARAS